MTISIASIEQFHLPWYSLIWPLETLPNMPNRQPRNWHIQEDCQLLLKWNIFWIAVTQLSKFINQLSKYIVRNTKLTVNVIGMPTEKLHNPTFTTQDQSVIWLRLFGGLQEGGASGEKDTDEKHDVLI